MGRRSTVWRGGSGEADRDEADRGEAGHGQADNGAAVRGEAVHGKPAEELRSRRIEKPMSR